MVGSPKKIILVTGGLGFIGGHLVERLVEKNWKVIVPYYYKTQQEKFNFQRHKNMATILKINILDFKKIILALQKYKVNSIIHLAAESQVTKALNAPLQTLRTNVMGTAAILEAAKIVGGIENIIIASSDKAYGKSIKSYRECDQLRGDHPYDVSKSSADLIAQTYYKTYHLPVIITRFGNVYGQADLHFERLIPGICRSIFTRKMFEVRSNGKYARDYLHIDDVVDGYLFLLKNFKKVKGGAFNFSSGDNLSVLSVIRKMENILDQKIPYKIVNNAVNEIPSQHLDDTKIRKLGWKSKNDMDGTIASVFSWYHSYFSK
ncbi:MAG: GDP-mannose 4,6-dehydratase [Patescibacteria group bacterium]